MFVTSTFFIPDHPELDAPVPAPHLPSHPARGRERADHRHREGEVSNLRLSGNGLHGGHRVPEPTGEDSITFVLSGLDQEVNQNSIRTQ